MGGRDLRWRRQYAAHDAGLEAYRRRQTSPGGLRKRDSAVWDQRRRDLLVRFRTFRFYVLLQPAKLEIHQRQRTGAYPRNILPALQRHDPGNPPEEALPGNDSEDWRHRNRNRKQLRD